MTIDLSPPATRRIKQALMLGIANNPLPATTSDALTVLALVAARSRLARATPPTRDSAEKRGENADRSRFLTDDARGILIRLLCGKDGKVSDNIAIAVMREIKHSGLRLHPFDYSRLEGFLAHFAGELGLEERQWLRAIRPDCKQVGDAYEDEPVTEATLAQASKAQKLSFLRELRRQDAAKARKLIEGLMPIEPANARNDLLGLLGSGLSESDKPFIEGLAGDRAQSVRDTAAMLLARLPGTDAYRKRLEQARDKIEIKKAGLLRRRRILSLRIEPRPHASHLDPQFQAMVENRELFHGLRLADLASVIGVSVDELIAGSAESADLGPLILKSAVLEAIPIDPGLFSSLSTGDAGHATLFLLKEALPEATGSMRAMLIEFCLSPENWSLLPAPMFFEQAYSFAREPLSHRLASNLIRSTIWRDGFKEAPDELKAQLAESVAPFVPRALAAAFISEIETHSRRAVLYHRFLLTLPEQPT